MNLYIDGAGLIEVSDADDDREMSSSIDRSMNR